MACGYTLCRIVMRIVSRYIIPTLTDLLLFILITRLFLWLFSRSIRIIYRRTDRRHLKRFNKNRDTAPFAPRILMRPRE